MAQENDFLNKYMLCSSKISVFSEVIENVAVNNVFHYFAARPKGGNVSVILDLVFWTAFIYGHYIDFLRRTFKSDGMMPEHDVRKRSGIPWRQIALLTCNPFIKCSIPS